MADAGSSSAAKKGLTQSILTEDLSAEWEKYKNSGLLDDGQYKAITSYISDTNMESRLMKLKTSPTPVVFKKLLGFHETTVIKYVLALIDQALQASPGIGSEFSDPNTFISLLKSETCNTDKFICWKACRILSHLFTAILDETQHEGEITSFISLMMTDLLQSHVEAVLFSLQLLLRKAPIRKLFAANQGIPKLKELLGDKDATVQVQYQAIFCLWLVSFEKDIAETMSDVVSRVVEVGRQSQKEKVMRISLATLRNLAVDHKNVEKMVESKLNKQLEIWSNKRQGDEDIKADLDFLTTTVNNMIDEMSSFERYRSEVLSGELEWTPVHFSESFWRDNISRLAEDNFQLIRVLSELLSSKESKPQTKAVACYDIGEFVRLHPAGRKVVTDLGTKTTIMSILYDTNTDAEVQKQALLCTRKMMVSNWEMLGGK